MKIITQACELPIGGALVPTMGALHAGHEELIRSARKLCDSVVVSIFINPLQFESPQDLAQYPQTPDADKQLAKNAGATTLWMARHDEIYPGAMQTISAGGLGEKYEGAKREGHFSGVLTVVKRLFDLAQPKIAFFGQKDFQQLFLIKKMVFDLGLDIEIIPIETLRSQNGLALSSRNYRLGNDGEKSALIISKALKSAKSASTLGDARQILSRTLLSEPAFTCDYAEIIDAQTFEIATDSTVDKRAIVAGWINGVRLIDNMTMTGSVR